MTKAFVYSMLILGQDQQGGDLMEVLVLEIVKHAAAGFLAGLGVAVAKAILTSDHDKKDDRERDDC